MFDPLALHTLTYDDATLAVVSGQVLVRDLRRLGDFSKLRLPPQVNITQNMSFSRSARVLRSARSATWLATRLSTAAVSFLSD